MRGFNQPQTQRDPRGTCATDGGALEVLSRRRRELHPELYSDIGYTQRRSQAFHSVWRESRPVDFLVEAQAAVWAFPDLLGTLQEVAGCSTRDGDAVAISEAAERPLTSRARDSHRADVHEAPEDNEGGRPDPCVTRSRSPCGNAWDKDRNHDPIVPPRPSIEVLPQRHAVRFCDRRLRRAATWLTKWAAPGLSYGVRRDALPWRHTGFLAFIFVIGVLYSCEAVCMGVPLTRKLESEC
jgi:hypothetical protein